MWSEMCYKMIRNEVAEFVKDHVTLCQVGDKGPYRYTETFLKIPNNLFPWS